MNDITCKGCAAVRGGLVLGLTVLLGACASNGGSFDEGANTTASESPERAAISRIMGGLGAIDSRQEAIEYKPRSPLVVPPNRDLRTPVEGDAVASSGAWPRDPDVIARERRRAAASQVVSDPGRNWTPEEMQRNNVARGIQSREDEELQRQSLLDPDFKQASRPLPPSQMQGSPVTAAAAIGPNGMPIRKRGLTDPPGSYMQPSPNAPMDVPKEETKSSWWPF